MPTISPPSSSPEQDPSPERMVERTLDVLRKDYIVIGKRHVKSWHAWLAIGLATGLAAGVILVANRSGEVEEGRASSLPVSGAKGKIIELNIKEETLVLNRSFQILAKRAVAVHKKDSALSKSSSLPKALLFDPQKFEMYRSQASSTARAIVSSKGTDVDVNLTRQLMRTIDLGLLEAKKLEGKSMGTISFTTTIKSKKTQWSGSYDRIKLLEARVKMRQTVLATFIDLFTSRKKTQLTHKEEWGIKLKAAGWAIRQSACARRCPRAETRATVADLSADIASEGVHERLRSGIFKIFAANTTQKARSLSAAIILAQGEDDESGAGEEGVGVEGGGLGEEEGVGVEAMDAAIDALDALASASLSGQSLTEAVDATVDDTVAAGQTAAGVATQESSMGHVDATVEAAMGAMSAAAALGAMAEDLNDPSIAEVAASISMAALDAMANLGLSSMEMQAALNDAVVSMSASMSGMGSATGGSGGDDDYYRDDWSSDDE